MVIVKNGVVSGGQLVLDLPVELSEGTLVKVRIEPLSAAGDTPASVLDCSQLPFFGMWADRKDIQDSADWVHEARRAWLNRIHQED